MQDKQVIVCHKEGFKLSVPCQHWVRNYRNAKISLRFPKINSQVNLLWPCDAIWRHNSGSTLPQVMACSLALTLDQFHSDCHNRIIWDNEFENYIFEITTTSPRGHWVKSVHRHNLIKCLLWPFSPPLLWCVAQLTVTFLFCCSEWNMIWVVSYMARL